MTDTDLLITRVFRAPRAIVWQFWTQPLHLSEWFGPTDYTVPLDSIIVELEVGGRLQLAMQSPDGERFPMRGIITELVPEELLVITADAETDGLGDLEAIALRVQFHDHGDLTRVTIQQGPFTPEQRTATEAGWEQSFAELDAAFTSEKS